MGLRPRFKTPFSQARDKLVAYAIRPFMVFQPRTRFLIGCAILVAVFSFAGKALPQFDPSFGILQAMMIIGVQLNAILIAFNLIPIPPLDGSHVMKYLLPPSWSLRYVQFGRMGVALLIVMMYLAPGLLNMWLSPALIAALEGTILQSTAQWLQ